MPFTLDNTVWKIIIDTMQEGLMVVDRAGRIVFVNQAFENLLGYSPEELVGKSCEVFQCDRCFNARANGLDKYCTLFKYEEIRSSECIFRHQNGTPLHLLKNAAVIRDQKGQVIGGVETLTDLSRVVASEEIIESLKRQLNDRNGFDKIIGRSPVMRQVFDLAGSAAHSEAPVVIYGESGTGKELLANALHQHSDRADGPFIKVNCAALNENLLESELFGHVKGAFTGADQKRIGRFEAAHSGTIFLDEIGDLPLPTQTKLLRVLQEKEIERVGDHRPIKIDVRILTATHKNLAKLIQDGRFREDLYYRINVIPITMPPLRQRGTDIALLVEKCVQSTAQRTGKKIERVDKAVLDILTQYSWPGNVRELLNIIEYAFVVCPGGKIEVSHLPGHLLEESQQIPSSQKNTVYIQTDNRRQQLIEALEVTDGNQSKAAEILGVSRVTVWKWVKKYGIKFGPRMR